MTRASAMKRTAVRRRGYEIRSAHSATRPWRKVRTQDFDSASSDIGFAGSSGYELRGEVVSTKNLPGIALSGFGTEQDVNKPSGRILRGIHKPINFERWKKTIRIAS